MERVLRVYVVLVLVLVTWCCLGSVRCEHLKLGGNVTVVGLFQLRGNSDGQCASSVEVESVMTAEAVKWYFQGLNSAGGLPFQIGFEGYPTCRLTSQAAELAVEVLQKSMTSADNPIIGVIGPEFSSEAEVVSQIFSAVHPDNRLVQLGVSATARSLRNEKEFPNFIRVVPDDSIQIKVMAKTLLQLEWNRIAIVYENDTYGQEGSRMLQMEAALLDICTAYTGALDVQFGVNQDQIIDIRKTILLGSNEIVAIEGVVVFGTQSTVNLLMQSFQTIGFSATPAFLVSESISLQASAFEEQAKPINKAKGAFAVAPPYREITEFTNYWKSIFTSMDNYETEVATNSWLKDVFIGITKCDPSEDNCTPPSQTQIDSYFQRQPLFIQYVVRAAHAIAQALETLYVAKCGSKSLVECPEFISTFKQGDMIDAIKGSTLSFSSDFPFILNSLAADNVQVDIDTDGEVRASDNEPSYQVYNYIKGGETSSTFTLVKVGDLIAETLTLDTTAVRDYTPDGTEERWDNRRMAQCPDGALCSECIPTDLPEWSIYESGDIYVVGLVPVYDSDPPDGCSKIRLVNGYQVAESIRFAVVKFNDKTGIYSSYFQGLRVGLIILNSCNNPVVIQRKLLNLHKEGISLPDGRILSMTGKIAGFVGPLGSAISIAASSVLGKLGRVQISYASTNPALSDRGVNPYFMRVVTPDDAQAKAMISMVMALGGDYIQVIYSAGAYGEGGFEEIKREGYANDVCVIQGLKVEEDGNYHRYYDELRKYPQAKIVIVFLRSHMVLPVMSALTSQLIRGDFIFIGSEAFAKNPYVLSGDGKLTTLGSFTLAQEMAKNQELDTYLRQSIQPVSYRENAWSKEYLQVKLNCSYSNSFDRTRDKDCSSVTSLSQDPTFASDTWAVSAYNAMIALLTGTSEYLTATCGANARQLCQDFLNNPGGLVEELKHVRLDVDGSGTPFKVFTDNGDGNIGFQIYNIQKDPDNPQKLIYVKVGQYPLQGTFRFEKTLISTPDGVPVVSLCPNSLACSQCIKAAEQDQSTTESETSIAAIVLGALFAVALLAAIILAVILFLRKRNADEDTYITPAAVSSESNASYDSNTVQFTNWPSASSSSLSDKEELPTTHY